jgi:hypothetical protein
LETTRLIDRPRNRWQDEVREDERLVSGEVWQEKVYNREEWKKLLNTVRNCHVLPMPMELMNEWITDSRQDLLHNHSDIKMVLLSTYATHCSVFCDRNFYGRSGVCLALHITPEKPSGWEYSVFVFLCKLILSLSLKVRKKRTHSLWV